MALLKTAHAKIKNLEAAEEIVQDVFITFYKKKDTIEDNPLLYLRAVLKFKILDYLKTQDKPIIIELNSSFDSTESNVLEKLDAIEAKKLIYKQILHLPEQCRDVFVLRKEFNMSNSQVAEQLGISIKTVEAHMTRALAVLKKHIEYYVLIAILTSLW